MRKRTHNKTNSIHTNAPENDVNFPKGINLPISLELARKGVIELDQIIQSGLVNEWKILIE